MLSKPKILILVNHYLPGFHYGGPIRSVANIVEWLGDEFEFRILTKDHDLRGEAPYPNIESGKWYTVGKAQVRYLSQQEQQIPNLMQIYRHIKYDALYLNIVFSALTIETLLLSRLGLLPKTPIVLASRGTLNGSALNLKSRKKSFFLNLARKTHLYQNLIWHATSDDEVTEIRDIFNNIDLHHIHCIENLPSPSLLSPSTPTVNKIPGQLHIIYLSRIDPKKNLRFALECLSQISGSIIFDIYGPIKDEEYWSECKMVISSLPSHIQINYKGSVQLDAVEQVLKGYHLFFLPTLNENFGHAIIEALCVGCPILISDRTPWDTAAEQGAGWALPLEQPEAFICSLQSAVDMGREEFLSQSKAAFSFGQSYLQTSSSVKDMRKFLRDVSL